MSTSADSEFNAATDDEALPEGFSDEVPSYSDLPYITLRLKGRVESDMIEFIPLPPIKTLKEQRRPFLYWKTHSYDGRDPQDPDRTRWIKILSVEQTEGREVVVPDPLFAVHEFCEAQIKKAEAWGLANKKPAKTIEAAQAKYKSFLFDKRVTGKSRFYGMTASGQPCIVELPYGLSKDYAKEMTKVVNSLVSEGLSGSALVRKQPVIQINRTMDKGRYKDVVAVKRAQVKGQAKNVFEDLYHVFTNAELTRCNDVLPDLEELRDRDKFPRECLEVLANEMIESKLALSPERVDEILGMAARHSARKGSGASTPAAGAAAPPADEKSNEEFEADGAGEEGAADEFEAQEAAPPPPAKAKPTARGYRETRPAPAATTQAKPAAAAAKPAAAQKQATKPAAAAPPPPAPDDDMNDVFEDDAGEAAAAGAAE